MPRAATPLAGRERELAALADELAAVAAGQARNVLLRGEAGIGKTALMEAACGMADDRATVLHTRNLPLTNRVPNLAIRSLLKQAEADGRTDAARQPLPIVLDELMDRLTAEGPVVLAIDDLQWADPSTLDALMYLAAGPEDRPLGIVATIRSVGSAHAIERWRSDVVRLPGTRSIEVGGLDRLGVTELADLLLGGPPHESLVTDVLERTRGNPYHACLLLAGVTPDAKTGPSAVAPDLEAAVLQAWSRLPEEAREVTTMLALYGRPASAHMLALADPAWNTSERALRPALETRILERDADGRLWFHHPLIAEVLVARVSAAELQARHATLAQRTATVISRQADASAELLVEHAHHLAAAGDARGALIASGRALEAMGDRGDRGDRLGLARRCIQLWDDGDDAVRDGIDRRGLLDRWATAANDAGAVEDEFAAVSALLDATDREADPLGAADLLVRKLQLAFRAGGGLPSADAANEAVSLAAHDRGRREYALALSELAHAEIVDGDPRALVHAAESLERARISGDTEVLAYALAANAEVAAVTRDLDGARRWAEEAIDVALAHGHHWAAMRASFWESYAQPSYRAGAARLRDLRIRLHGAGAPHRATALMALTEAHAWLAIGEVGPTRAALRAARAEDPGPAVDLSLRLEAAGLAARQGRADDAHAHLRRAAERHTEMPLYMSSSYGVTVALWRFAVDDADGALQAARAGIDAPLHGALTEWLVPLAARALADTARTARDRREDTAVVLAQVDALEGAHPTVLHRMLGAVYPADIAALDALYRAELARAREDADAGTRWAKAADAAAAAELAWEEAYACRRAAEHGLTRAYGSHDHSRETAIAMLRRGVALARRLDAETLSTELDELASAAHVRLDDGTAPAVDVDMGSDMGSTAPLTRRERELLPYVVAGRTYAEIAVLLSISPKTVSSHISNLLRKTGASNRVDLARIVRGRAS